MKYIQKIFIFALLLCSVTLGAQVTATITHVKAPNKGSITLQMNSGTAPYTYEWYKKATPNTIIATSKDLTNLDAGEYCVIIHDAKCCSAEQCFTVKDECSGDYVKVSYKKNSSDCGIGQTTPATNGKIEIDVPNPADYTYCWKEFPNEPTCRFTTQNIDQIGIGTYYLTVTNINTGCKVTLETKICCCYDASFELEDPNSTPHPSACSNNEGFGTPLDVVATPTPPTNATGGSIDLNITGGQSSNYTIKWASRDHPSFHSADASINNLAPGKYCYTVTDGCTEESDCFDMYVCGDNPISITGKMILPCDFVKNINGVVVDDRNSGKITISVSGGKAPYKFSWSNTTQTGATISGLVSGTYCVVVTDKSGCTSRGCFTLGNGVVKPIPSTFPCQTTYLCGNERIIKTEIFTKDCVKDDPFFCDVINCYCPATGVRVSTDLDKNVLYDIDEFNCTGSVTCFTPNQFGSTFSNLGSGKIFTVPIFMQTDPSCVCGLCGEQDVCDISSIFPNQPPFLIPNTWRQTGATPSSGSTTFSSSKCSPLCASTIFCDGLAAGSFCTKCNKPPSGLINTTLDIFTVGDMINSLKRKIEASEDVNVLVPVGINANSTVNEFNMKWEEINSSKPETIPMIILDMEGYEPQPCESFCSSEGGGISSKIAKNNPNLTTSSIKVYPNPIQNSFTVEVPFKNFPKSTIEILNSLGQKVYIKECSDESITEINTEKFATGSYIVIVKDCNNNQIFSQNIIKQ